MGRHSMTRLDEIRANVDSGGCDQCAGTAELLDALDAFLSGKSLEDNIEHYRKQESWLNSTYREEEAERLHLVVEKLEALL